MKHDMSQGQRLDRLRSAASRFTLLLAVLAVSLPAACGGAEPAAAPAQEPTESVEAQPSPPTEAPPATESTAPGDTGVTEAALPPAVAETRDAIISAAHGRDYATLEALLDPATFSYSFGESGDPIGYWRGLEDEGEVPFSETSCRPSSPCTSPRRTTSYVWPAAHAKDAPSAWTKRRPPPHLRLLYSRRRHPQLRGDRQVPRLPGRDPRGRHLALLHRRRRWRRSGRARPRTLLGVPPAGSSTFEAERPPQCDSAGGTAPSRDPGPQATLLRRERGGKRRCLLPPTRRSVSSLATPSGAT